MYKSFFSKQGLITANLARDFISLDVGDRIPTIEECASLFSVSRGVVQNAIAFLEDNHCITLYKGGKNGSFITWIDYAALHVFTGWNSLIGTMPIPLNDCLSSLATVFYSELKKLPVPATIAYVSGAEARKNFLVNMYYDFTVTSAASAKEITESNRDIEELTRLTGCRYSPPYCLFFSDGGNTEIKDGMRIAVDYNCIDQANLTAEICGGKRVDLIETPYIGTYEAISSHCVDAAIYRNENLFQETGFFPQPLPVTANIDYITPVILINRKNHGLRRLLQKHFSQESFASIQRKVLNKELPNSYY